MKYLVRYTWPRQEGCFKSAEQTSTISFPGDEQYSKELDQKAIKEAQGIVLNQYSHKDCGIEVFRAQQIFGERS